MPRWQFTAASTSHSYFDEVLLGAGPGALYVAKGSGVVALDSATGRRRWSIDMGHMASYEAILGARSRPSQARST
jgi:outer membrane protein assembly factor BamB